MANYEKLIEIDEQIKAKYKTNVVLDGIVNFNKYTETNPKILWILKESNVTTPDETFKNGVFELNEYLNEDIAVYPDWKRTWGLVLEISDAILHNAKNWNDEVPLVDRLKNEDVIKSVAVINIKKTSGGSLSDKGEIGAYYQDDKNIILSQIEAIAPDIIINCSGIDQLLNDLMIGNPKNVEHFKIAKFKNGIIINAYHPNQRNISHEEYFKIINKCLAEME